MGKYLRLIWGRSLGAIRGIEDRKVSKKGGQGLPLHVLEDD
jgi:hypothetical protein